MIRIWWLVFNLTKETLANDYNFHNIQTTTIKSMEDKFFRREDSVFCLLFFNKFGNKRTPVRFAELWWSLLMIKILPGESCSIQLSSFSLLCSLLENASARFFLIISVWALVREAGWQDENCEHVTSPQWVSPLHFPTSASLFASALGFFFFWFVSLLRIQSKTLFHGFFFNYLQRTTWSDNSWTARFKSQFEYHTYIS